jgi:hypothetical protein
MTDCFQEYDNKKAVNYLINFWAKLLKKM